MYKESKKMRLIEEVIKVEDKSTLSELETILKKPKKHTDKKAIQYKRYLDSCHCKAKFD